MSDGSAPDREGRPVRRVVVWRVTTACNLSCPFCAHARDLGRLAVHADPERVLALGRRLAREATSEGRTVLVSWLGGEPLLWTPLTGLTRRFRELGCEIATTSNGTPLGSDRVRRHLLECYDELTLSVDGVGPVHDRLRRWPGGFELLRRSIGDLVEARERVGSRLRLRVNTVLLRPTIDRFGELCRELATWGVDEVSFNALGGRDRPEFFPGHALGAEQIRRLAGDLPELRRRLAPRGLTILGSDAYLERLLATAEGRPLPGSSCRPGADFLFIDEQCRLAPCSFTVESCGVESCGVEAGCPERSSAIGSAARLAARRDTIRPAVCRDCPSTFVHGKFHDIDVDARAEDPPLSRAARL